MSNWTSGYVADIDYTFGYYQELNPLHCQLGLLNKGIQSCDIKTACELGFGQGLSSNFHAAASPVRWWGTDFNPGQASFAQELAKVSESGARLYDQAFDEFCQRDDLPGFDYIGLHGIWSWISDENRHIVVDFIRRKLNVGGVLYLSYNTLPGWAEFVPIQHLLSRHADLIGNESGDVLHRIDNALKFAQDLLDLNPAYKAVNPGVEERLGKSRDKNRHYLAHEFFNKDWHPMHFATAADWLDPAKVSFACSALFLDHIDKINLSTEQQKFVAGIRNPVAQQSIRDFMVNQQFRRDYWVKGLRRRPLIETADALKAQRVVMVTPGKAIPLKIAGGQGEAVLNKEIYETVIDLLSDHKPVRIEDLQSRAVKKDSRLNTAMVLEALMVLSSGGHVYPTQADDVIENVKSEQTSSITICKEKPDPVQK